MREWIERESPLRAGCGVAKSVSSKGVGEFVDSDRHN